MGCLNSKDQTENVIKVSEKGQIATNEAKKQAVGFNSESEQSIEEETHQVRNQTPVQNRQPAINNEYVGNQVQSKTPEKNNHSFQKSQ